MSKVRLHTTENLCWPNKCAFCGDTDTDMADAIFNEYGDFRWYVVFIQWNRKRRSIRYPVCAKHKRLASILNKPSEWGIFNSAVILGMAPLCVLTAAMGIVDLLGLPQGTASSIVDLTINFAYSIAFLFFILCYLLKPVRLLKVSTVDTSVKLSIRRKDYFEEFKSLNRGIIIADEDI